MQHRVSNLIPRRIPEMVLQKQLLRIADTMGYALMCQNNHCVDLNNSAPI